MMAFLVDDYDHGDWPPDPDEERRDRHTSIMEALAILLLGLWLMGSMAHPPGPPPPGRLVEQGARQ